MTTATPAAQTPARPVVGTIRNGVFTLTLIASVYVFFMLYLFSTVTDGLFAWSMSPLQAASLGAAYGGSAAMFALALRAKRWVDVTIAVYPAGLLLALMLTASLLDTDKLKLTNGTLVTTGAAWGWIGVQIALLVALAIGLLAQRGATGADPAPESMPLWIAVPTGLFGLSLLAVGACLFAAPAWTATWWGWTLSTLDARALGAWTLAFGFAAVYALRVADLWRMRAGLAAWLVAGALGLIALARYSGEINWDKPGAWLYLAALVLFVGNGIGGLLLGYVLREDVE